MATATERLMTLPDVEITFQAFVRNANALARQARTRRADGVGDPSIEPEFAPEFEGDLAPESTMPDAVHDPSHPLPAPSVVSLGSVPITGTPDASPKVFGVPEVGQEVQRELEEELEPEPLLLTRPTSRPPPPAPLSHGGAGSDSQRLEAERLVPDVASVKPPAPPLPEASEDGEMPPRELERVMGEMTVLLRYGHKAEVAERLDQLIQAYPQDLLLLRRIAEFHLESGSTAAARDCLFRLASALFQRKNVVGMRAALEQVLVLEPGNPRATKLLLLLDRR